MVPAKKTVFGPIDLIIINSHLGNKSNPTVNLDGSSTSPLINIFGVKTPLLNNPAFSAGRVRSTEARAAARDFGSDGFLPAPRVGQHAAGAVGAMCEREVVGQLAGVRMPREACPHGVFGPGSKCTMLYYDILCYTILYTIIQ